MAALDFVYNPVSGSFDERRMAAFVSALEGEGFDVRPMPTTRDGAQLSGTADLVCVHGGDGTLRDVVQALGRRAGEVPLAIAASGTINLVARELRYPKKPAPFAKALRAAWDRGRESWLSAPLYTLGDMPVVSCLSIGPDSQAVARVSDELKGRIGRYAYVVALAQQMREWSRQPMTVRGELADGTSFETQAEAVIASHGALYAGPFRLSAKAALHADSIELVTLHRSTRLGTLALSTAAMLRLPIKRLGLADIRTVRRVEFDRCVLPVQVDGDHMPDCAYAIGPSGMALTYVV